MPVDLSGRYRLLVIIWGALFASTLLYAGVAYFLLTRGEPAPLSMLEEIILLSNILLGMSALNFLLSFILKKYVLAGVQLSDNPEIRARRFFTATIIALALSEAVALFGLVLVVRSKMVVDFYPFLSLALLMFFLHFPRRSAWQECVEAAPSPAPPVG